MNLNEDAERLSKMLTDFEACTVNVSNQTPCALGVTIIGIVVEWTYDDGSKSTQALPNAYLSCNQSTSLVSLTECVQNTFVVMRVKVSGEANERLITTQRAVPADSCAVTANVVLGPRSSIPKEVFSKGKVASKDFEVFIT